MGSITRDSPAYGVRELELVGGEMAGAFVFHRLPPGAKAIWGGKDEPRYAYLCIYQLWHQNRFSTSKADLTVILERLLLGKRDKLW